MTVVHFSTQINLININSMFGIQKVNKIGDDFLRISVKGNLILIFLSIDFKTYRALYKVLVSLVVWF